MESNLLKKYKTGVCLVQTKTGMRLFNSFKEAQEAALENNTIITCGGAV